MKILSSLFDLLSTFGPTAPAAPKAESGPKSLEASDRGMFDDPEGDPEVAGAEPEEPETPEEPQAEAPEEPEGEQDEEPQASAEESDEDEPEATEEPEDEDEDDDVALTLRTATEARLDANARANPQTGARISIDKIRLRDDAKKRFQEIVDKDDEGKMDAEGIFEIAMDAALQTLSAYHQEVASPSGEKVSKEVRQIRVGRTLNAWKKQMGERLTTEVETKMGSIYKEFAEKYGWREADTIPLKTLYRMAGGRGKGAAKAAPAADPAKAQKAEALGAAAKPRTIGRTTPEKGAEGPKKEDRALREFAQDARARRPFFTLG